MVYPAAQECAIPRTDERNVRADASSMQRRLSRWLIEDACPLWSSQGVDWIHGGFHERLAGNQGLDEPRRARVPPRQIYALSNAAALGWSGDVRGLVTRGLASFIERYRRPDGLFRSLVAADGRVLDDRVVLYDQAFALLGFAEARRVLGSQMDLEAEARRLRETLYRCMKHAGGGFESGTSAGTTLSANAHMHLLEAGLAWRQLSDDPHWAILCDEIGELALSRFIDPATGAVRENFTPDWAAVPGEAGRLIEPGHQFEWAWLLCQWERAPRTQARLAAFHLIDIGEQHGVRNGVAINSMRDDYSVIDGSARLWVQAERLRTAAFAARVTGETRYWRAANDAAIAICFYLQRDVPGTWYDRQTPEGLFIEEPAPASTFYHIVGAIKEFTVAVRAD